MKGNLALKNLAMPLALLAISGFFFAVEPAFLGARNLTQLFIEFSIVATLALGMFMVLLTGNIDLSVGSGVGLIGGIGAVLIFHHAWPAPAAMLASILVALVLWMLMGSLIVKERIPSFIITLGGLLVFKGLFWLVIQNATVPVSRGGENNLYAMLTTYYLPDAIGYGLAAGISAFLVWIEWATRKERMEHGLPVEPVAQAGAKLLALIIIIFGAVTVLDAFRGVPLSLIVLILASSAVYFLTRHTPFGRYLYAIGGNEEAAVLSGINVHRVIIAAYVLMGLMVAATGFMQTAFSGSSTTTVGDLMELDAIAACVIGGTALKGGRGSVGGVLFGALIMTALLNGMTLLAVSPELKFIARGGVLALAVWMDVRFSRSERPG